MLVAIMNEEELFIDSGFSQCNCFSERVCGDVVRFRRIPEERRMIAVLADGLGHGLKANILASMTATMALRFIAADREIVHSAEIIMDTLPVCRTRGISYATFTIADIRADGELRLVEMGNPEFTLLRNGRPEPVPARQFASPKYRDREMSIRRFPVRPLDRVIFCSDGVTQAGTGRSGSPEGWTNRGLREYAARTVADAPEISAQELAERIMREAVAHERGLRPGDDISVVTLHFRPPRRLLVFTGPPQDPERDAECGRIFSGFPGEKIVCGGTSARIIARELKLKLRPDPESAASDLPPASIMPGADLVTEGIYTLTRAARYLDGGDCHQNDPAGRLVEYFRRNDVIEFLVGTRINQAHQDPNLPVELEVRRNLVHRVADLLRDRYMKEVEIRFI